MTVGDFLVAYLRKAGVRHVFGIPGDLALKLFFALGKTHDLEILTFSHEPRVGFAADGYARATGKIGVVCVPSGPPAPHLDHPLPPSLSHPLPLLLLPPHPPHQ